MYCPRCGAPHPDGVAACRACGTVFHETVSPYAPPASTPLTGGKIPNYLVQAILVTLCCCLPAGIVAIVYAAQVDGKVALGDLETARRYSRLAYIWSWVSFGSVLLIYGVYLIVLLTTRTLST
ncbi:MAG TPA: CD225/dispanin family protein [Candidatus Polarisedimenticolaceae bacterium]